MWISAIYWLAGSAKLQQACVRRLLVPFSSYHLRFKMGEKRYSTVAPCVLRLCQSVGKKSQRFWRNGFRSSVMSTICTAILNVTITHCFINCWIFLKWKENLGKTETELGNGMSVKKKKHLWVCLFSRICERSNSAELQKCTLRFELRGKWQHYYRYIYLTNRGWRNQCFEGTHKLDSGTTHVFL